METSTLLSYFEKLQKPICTTRKCGILKCSSIKWNVSYVTLNGHVKKKKKIHFGLMSLKHHFKITSDTFHITAVCLRISHSVVVMVVRKFAC